MNLKNNYTFTERANLIFNKICPICNGLKFKSYPEKKVQCEKCKTYLVIIISKPQIHRVLNVIALSVFAFMIYQFLKKHDSVDEFRNSLRTSVILALPILVIGIVLDARLRIFKVWKSNGL